MANVFGISVRSDLRKVIKTLSNLEKQQLPFAVATALTGIAKRVQAAEKAAMPKVFDRPTPFTVNSIGVKAARKSNLQARVFVKDIAAAYLEPYEFGGNHALIGSGKTWLNPKDRTLLNQFGNISQNTLKRFEGRADIFVGTIKTKAGESIGGVWQRPVSTKVTKKRGKRGVAVRGANETGHLKLLIRFGDAEPVKQHLGFRVRAQAIAGKYFLQEFAKALQYAVATAK